VGSFFVRSPFSKFKTKNKKNQKQEKKREGVLSWKQSGLEENLSGRRLSRRRIFIAI